MSGKLVKSPRKNGRAGRTSPACELSIAGLAKLSSEKDRRRTARTGMVAITSNLAPLYAMPHAVGDDTVYRVGRGGRLLHEWSHRELVEKLDPIDPRYRHLIEFLFYELQIEALRAEFATEVAKVELRIDAKRSEGGKKAGKASAKPARSIVEKMVRACLGRGDDPGVYATDWALYHGYTVRQIRNIIQKVRAE